MTTNQLYQTGFCKKMPFNEQIPLEIEKVSVDVIREIQEDYYECLKAIKHNAEMNENINELCELDDNLQNRSEHDPFLLELSNKYPNIEAYCDEITKPTSDSIVKIVSEDNTAMITNLVKPKNPDEIEDHYFYTNKQPIKELINKNKKLWGSLRIPYEIKEENPEIIKDLIDDLTKLQSDFKIDNSKLINNLENTNSNSIKLAIEKIIEHYTSNEYSIINKILITNNTMKLEKMRYYINLLAYNNRKALIGKKYKETNSLYRNIFVDYDIFKLYQVENYIYFTNLTSTSRRTDIMNNKTEETPEKKIHILFEFRLLNIKEQEEKLKTMNLNIKDAEKKLPFYPGFDIIEISKYKKEEEILITPYQIFQIGSISMIKENDYIITLNELEDKSLIENIMAPMIVEKKDMEETNIIAKTFQKKQNEMPVKTKNINTMKIPTKYIQNYQEKTHQYQKKILTLKEKIFNNTNKVFLANHISPEKKKKISENLQKKGYNIGLFENQHEIKKSKLNKNKIIEEFFEENSKDKKINNYNFDNFVHSFKNQFSIEVKDETKFDDFIGAKMVKIVDKKPAEIAEIIKLQSTSKTSLIFQILQKMYQDNGQQLGLLDNPIERKLPFYAKSLLFTNKNVGVVKIVLSSLSVDVSKELEKIDLKVVFSAIEENYQVYYVSSSKNENLKEIQSKLKNFPSIKSIEIISFFNKPLFHSEMIKEDDIISENMIKNNGFQRNSLNTNDGTMKFSDVIEKHNNENNVEDYASAYASYSHSKDELKLNNDLSTTQNSNIITLEDGRKFQVAIECLMKKKDLECSINSINISDIVPTAILIKEVNENAISFLNENDDNGIKEKTKKSNFVAHDALKSENKKQPDNTDDLQQQKDQNHGDNKTNDHPHQHKKEIINEKEEIIPEKKKKSLICCCGNNHKK